MVLQRSIVLQRSSLLTVEESGGLRVVRFLRFFGRDVIQSPTTKRTQHRTGNNDGCAEQSDQVDVVSHDPARPDGCRDMGQGQSEKRARTDHCADSGGLPVLEGLRETRVADEHVRDAISEHEILLAAEVLDLCQGGQRQHEYGTNRVQHSISGGAAQIVSNCFCERTLDDHDTAAIMIRNTPIE